MNCGLIGPLTRSSLDSNICSSVSQNISGICDACFPNRISRSFHLAGDARRRSMTQVARGGVTLNLFRVVALLSDGQATASIILMISCLRNLKCSSAFPSVRPLKLKLNALELIRLLLSTNSSTSFLSLNAVYATCIIEFVDVKAYSTCIIRRLPIATITAFHCDARRSVDFTV